jgi:hypothetical protein
LKRVDDNSSINKQPSQQQQIDSASQVTVIVTKSNSDTSMADDTATTANEEGGAASACEASSTLPLNHQAGSSDLDSAKLNLTSTPQSNLSRNSAADLSPQSDEAVKSPSGSSLLDVGQLKKKNSHSSLSSESKKYMLNSISKNVEDDDDDNNDVVMKERKEDNNNDDEEEDDEEDEDEEDYKDHVENESEEQFYDHNEQLNKQFSAENAATSSYLKLARRTGPSKKYSIYWLITITLAGTLLLVIVVSFVKYLNCNLTTSSRSVVAANCHFTKAVTSTVNTLSYRVSSLIPYFSSNSHYRWISWPISAPNSTKLNLDPLISWFFSKYEPE